MTPLMNESPNSPILSQRVRSSSRRFDGRHAALQQASARSLQERSHRHKDEQAKCCKQRKSGTCKQGFDLEASSRAGQTPFAEVLTVIGQQPIAVFSHTGSCSADDLLNVEIGWRIRSHSDALSAREMSERNFFHRSNRPDTVLHDLQPPSLRPLCAVRRLSEQSTALAGHPRARWVPRLCCRYSASTLPRFRRGAR
jgi:hypothetical protein